MDANVPAPAFLTDIEPTAKKKKVPGAKEYSLQVQIVKFCKEAVTCPHWFAAFDRSQNHSGMQHMWEAARGVKAGTPDTLLLTPGKAIFCELKTPGNRPSPVQEHIGSEIQAAGHHWFWADSVASYRVGLMLRDIPLVANSWLIAEHRDALLASAAIKRAAAPKRAAKPKAPKVSAARLRKLGAVRGRVRF